ncbi:TRAP transporter substrate-binding protein [Bradyrhizobium sp. NP1]|jgi:tripartite ATP-independent transporter DctP family solute receptor|uniref:TRAP transporter substrate-binding protein n=1 Tax=Bradyrhizobium sp. NP1 TaxID=3049772 RepID=UPI0025A68E62|nr:TRAP transporter substrate-binding protein [Bradyrhizobium sp. NP1]WJR77296.1 TRAP transporter substrate-binding protein [Bradyrhizobium sp. NP1]
MTRRKPFDRRRRRFLNLSVLGAASLLVSRGAPAQPAIIKLPKKITLKAATITPENFPYVDGFRSWKNAIESRTGGDVDFQIYHTAQLGDERTINEGILAGAIHIGVGAGAWAGFVPAYNVVELPFLIRDMAQMYSLADGALGVKIGEQAASKGFKVLAYFSAGDQHFQTRKAPIQSLADFKGVKMRVIQNRAVIDGFRALGAVPTPLPYPEIYTALQQGTVDGTANDLLTVTLAKFYEVVKFFTWSSYVVEPRPVIMSKAFFESLPADFQAVLSDTAREAAVIERKVFEDRTASAREEAKKNGMTFVELSDRDKWVEAMRPVWEEFGKATPGAAELIKTIQSS